jgi:hypothetical protein
LALTGVFAGTVALTGAFAGTAALTGAFAGTAAGFAFTGDFTTGAFATGFFATTFARASSACKIVRQYLKLVECFQQDARNYH